jgi:hypothetical protein
MSRARQVPSPDCLVCGEALDRYPERPCPRCHRPYHTECLMAAGCVVPRCLDPVPDDDELVPMTIGTCLPVDQAAKASCVRRTAAWLLDTGLELSASTACMVPALAIGMPWTEAMGLFSMAWISAILVNGVLLTGLQGASLGKRAVGIKVVTEDGEAPGIVRSLVREIPGKVLSRFPWGLGFLLAAVDRETRALHDRIAGTWVVEVEE